MTVRPDAAMDAVAGEAFDIEYLDSRLSLCDSQGAPLRVTSARMLSDAPGKRAVVTLETAGAAGPGPDHILKAYADRPRAARLHATLTSLAPVFTRTLRTPRPAALLEEIGACVMERAPGLALADLAGDDRLAALGLAGAWLATLHRASARFERVVKPASELRKVGEWQRLVADLQPGCADLAASLAERIRARSSVVTLTTVSPIHKDFQHQHAFINGATVTVVDLDEVRMGDPAMDVAQFRVYLRLLGGRETQDTGSARRQDQAFLAGYASRAAPPDEHRQSFFAAYSCLKLAKQLGLGRGPAQGRAGASPETTRAVLEEGVQWLAP